MTIEELIRSAEACTIVWGSDCQNCFYNDVIGEYMGCRKGMILNLLNVLKARLASEQACKVENRPIDARKEAEPISMLAPIKSPSEGAFEVLWTEGGEGRKLRFTDMENATIFTDLLLNAKRNVGEVTVRRSKW